MMTLKRVALPIVCMTLLAACGGGAGGSASNTGGNTGATGSAGNTGGTNNTGGSGTAVGATGNSGDAGSAGGATSGNAGGSTSNGGSDTNTGGDSTDPGSTGTDGGASDGNSPGEAGGAPSEPVRTGPARAAEGVYAGALTGGSYHYFETLILEDGQYWSIYGENSGSYLYVHGFIQGSGSSENGVFTATDVRDFGVSPAAVGSMSATYDESAHTISGTSTFDGAAGPVELAGGSIPDSPYNYDTAASIPDLIGHWNGTSAASVSVALTVSPDGAFSMIEEGCFSTGTMKPRASNKNVFDVSVSFGASPCAMANETATGVAVAYPLTSTGQMQLIAAVVSSSRTQGMAFFANR